MRWSRRPWPVDRRRQAGGASRSCGRGAPLAFSGSGCCYGSRREGQGIPASRLLCRRPGPIPGRQAYEARSRPMTDDLHRSHLPATSTSIPMPTHISPVTSNLSLHTSRGTHEFSPHALSLPRVADPDAQDAPCPARSAGTETDSADDATARAEQDELSRTARSDGGDVAQLYRLTGRGSIVPEPGHREWSSCCLCSKSRSGQAPTSRSRRLGPRLAAPQPTTRAAS